MSTNYADDNRSQEDRINGLKQQAEQAAGSEMTAWESDTLSAGQREQFWRRVVDYETAPTTNHFQQLTEAGLKLVDPEATDDGELTSKLWEVIAALARIQVFITSTNHLSDRELYTLLWRVTLREEIPMLPDDRGFWHVSLLGDGGDRDTYLYLKYYADQDMREQWLADFPDDDMPAHEDPAVPTVTVTCHGGISNHRPRQRPGGPSKGVLQVTRCLLRPMAKLLGISFRGYRSGFSG